MELEYMLKLTNMKSLEEFKDFLEIIMGKKNNNNNKNNYNNNNNNIKTIPTSNFNSPINSLPSSLDQCTYKIL